eukprot:CAMPEP_0197192294 /NCGR_PEP_ID=MMETSP1423-20130617/24838_1 /TAXON_ID=476441 /ORGANISM="Pseudo-nitzschia heimii, Strain UNC1101" /LENGTH=342 /DNA_ID=CAMNT_0042645153 /DNA_START=113 /DNA_END=1141 /DNA_ORIENTATION=-
MRGHIIIHQTRKSVGHRYNILAFTFVAVIILMTEALTIAPTPSTLTSSVEMNFDGIHYNVGSEPDCVQNLSRRGVFRQGLKSVVIGSTSFFARTAQAKVAPTATEGLLSASAVADLIRPVPTFTIVDKKGIPYTVVGEDAKVTGYFFTTYTEASRILQLATRSADKAIAKAKADKEKEVGINPWKNARISTVPLDYAVTVVSKAMNTSGGGVYFKIAPAEDDINDALAVTGDKDLAEGKVPLFYYEDFTIDDGENKKTPLYFSEKELEKEWRRANKSKVPPKTSVTELFSLLAELVRPGGSNDELRNLVFVPPKESKSKSQDCIKKGGKEPAFVVGKRIVVL